MDALTLPFVIDFITHPPMLGLLGIVSVILCWTALNESL